MGWYDNNEPFEFSELTGKVLSSIDVNDGRDVLIFTCEDGEKFKMFHEQDCCENVYLEDICGDLNDLLNSQILSASEESNRSEGDYGTQTWTFYKIATIKGSVTLRWLGESNGYYSESVDFEKIIED